MQLKTTAQRVLAKVFRPFTKVEPHEAAMVAVMTGAAFLLLTAYYLLKTVREPLILLQGGAETKLYARAGQTIIMVGVVWLYGELARRVGRMRLLGYVFVFFLSNLAIFTVLARTTVPIGLVFFVWVGVFSYTVVAQFWGLAADIYTEEQGKRLFPIIGGGSSIGAVAGARLAKALVPYGPHVLMGSALAILVVMVALVVLVERRHIGVTTHKDDAHPDKPISSEGAFHLLARDKYLLLIAGLVILLNCVNSSGEYLLDRILVATAHESHVGSETAFIGAFKADYFGWYNLLGVVLQLFAVSRIFKLVGVRNALFFMPVFAFGAYGVGALFPVLAVIRIVKIGENGFQYSLQETTRHALFLGASRVEKYVGKTAVDTIAVRMGAILSSIVVMVGTHFRWTTRTFAIIDVVLAGGWFVFALLVGREQKRRGGEAKPPTQKPVRAEKRLHMGLTEEHGARSSP